MHTEEEIQRAAKLADELDPSGAPMDDTTDLRTLAESRRCCAHQRGSRSRAGGTRSRQRPVPGRNRDRARRVSSGSSRAIRREALDPALSTDHLTDQIFVTRSRQREAFLNRLAR